jgi:5'-methylthioadenosine phosphorylase
MILGVLGGSGLYAFEGLEDVSEHDVATPFGAPSAPVVSGRLGGAHVLFLPRHGRGHRFLPSEINYRANVHALKQLGAERVLSISAVGSLREGLAPGDVVLVDQFIDKTYRRATSYFGDGVVGHVGFSEPVCADLAGTVAQAAAAAGYVEAAGAERVLSISAVGSLREGLAPGDVVLVDQFIDKTYRRATSYFGDGVVGHVGFSEPVCADLAGTVAQAATAAGYVEAAGAERARAIHHAAGRAPHLHRGGTYVCMEGPQFSTRAESLLHRAWGADTIGMTAATEAKLCREAELCFSALALVTDYDAWHDDEAPVSVDAVIQVLLANVSRARDVIRHALPLLQHPRTCACGQAAARAIMTSPEAIPAAARERLKALYGRYL